MVTHETSQDINDPPRHEHMEVVPRRSVLRFVPPLIVVFVGLALLQSVVLNPNFEWPLVGSYLFSTAILEGLATTLGLTAMCMLTGAVLGIIIAVMHRSEHWLVVGFAKVYIWFFRGTPILVQLIFWYNLAALFPNLSIGVPFGPSLFTVNTNTLITPFMAAFLGLSLNEGAYMAEIVRAGIGSVDTGQEEAARAIGMTRLRAMRRIVLPQAMPFIIPPTGNETIGMLKMTSLVSVISLSDLLYSAQTIYSRNFEVIPLLLVCCCWYLLLTSVLTVIQGRIERHYARGRHSATPQPGERT
ncbi:amino acid ABC transporter permease [Consotaella salsifontis]|uniref:Glutamate/aspartate import permease protein GltK n=1 Tax=Consotaella salsifontis TaxID=1365950 RepID=A0A1T4SNN5_9HYPH|nr:amino acid ABC transporter permease [Consotaella salsifontis]SKA29870.1 amino acid ABC transporter membrane protein, PAAT family [Consotaella salsifontis]